MEKFYQLLAVVGAGLIIWLLYRTIKHRPEQFSADKMKSSFSTMGILALVLIAFVGLLVLILRQS